MFAPVASCWTLDPAITFLNHGSFGACPRVVLEAQARLREALEREPVRFFVRELEGRYDRVRERIGALCHADPEGIAFVTNATAGVNTVLRSLDFAPGDEILITNHGYNACSNAARYVAERQGARVVVATIPFPLESADAVVAGIVAAASARTRLAVIDHV